MTNCIFAYNQSNLGGAIYIYDAAPTAVNCTFVANQGVYGGAIYNANGSPAVSNCILWGNSATASIIGMAPPADFYNASSTSSIIIKYCITQLNQTGTRNNVLDPLFVNAANPIGPDGIWGTSDDGLHLQFHSGGIDAGADTLVPAGITTDLTGAMRIQHGIVDIGAYEATPVPCSFGAVVYVDSSKATTGNGSSWANAYKTVAEALKTVNACNSAVEIWVAKGTYYPMDSGMVVASSHDSSFRVLRNGIKLYGGFAGGETVLSARNVLANPTILSGNLGGSGNSYRVVTVVSNNTIDANTCIDGFTVRDGDGWGTGNSVFTVSGMATYRSYGGGMYIASSSPAIRNCTFSYNTVPYFGGGMYNDRCAPAISNCIFSYNTTYNWGAGIYNANASPTITNCIFAFNTAGTSPGYNGVGGGLANVGGSPIITNCLFFSNTAFSTGGAVFNSGTSPTFTNCTFVSNSSVSGGGMYNWNNSTVTLANCILRGNAASGGIDDIQNYTNGLNNNTSTSSTTYSNTQTPQPGTGNSTADPVFVDITNAIGPDGLWRTADDGLRLAPCSPAINTGSNAAIPTGITTDIRDTTRIQNTTVDRGAYEMEYNSIGGSSTTSAASPANSVCSTTSITFTATTIVPGTVPLYQWFKNGVAVGSNSTSYTSNSWNNGDSVWVVHTNNNCNVTDTSNKSYVQLVPVPAQPGTITGPANPCPGTQTYSIGAVTGATTYTWSVPAGWTITAGQSTTSVTVTSTSAAGSVTVTANNSCGAASVSRSSTVTPLTAPMVPSGPAAVCASSTGNVYSVPAVAGATTYTWSVPTGWVITAGQGTTSITVTAAAGNTSGSISVNATNSCQTSGNTALAVTGGNVVPALLVGSNSGTSICAGTSVTFTATPTNGGTAPAYQWKKNGVAVGTNSITYTDAGLVTGDVITATLTTNIACASTSTVTATAPAITVVPNVVPAVSIAGSATLVLCVGTSNTFTATGTNGGTAATYQWYKNGVAISGATGSSYTGSSFANNDSVYVVLTSSAICRTVDTVRSSAVKLTVYPYSTPSLLVGSNSGNTVCQGASVIFTATPFNGGTAPSYQWKKNGVAVGTNSATYTDANLATGDVVTVTLTSNSPCATTATVTASGPPIAVVPNVMPTLSINGPATRTLCAGDLATFTSSSTAGGPTPTYQWYKNGIAIAGQTAPAYTGFGFANGDSVWVVFAPTVACRLADTVKSIGVKLLVYPNVVPTVTVTASPGLSVPAGSSVTFTANVTAGATNATYQWYKNGVAIAGATGSTYTTSTLKGGDLISVGVTNLGPCASPASLISAQVRISDPAGISTVSSGNGGWQASLLLHPNPNSGRFTVSANWGAIAAGEKVQVEVVNALGQSVFHTEITLKEAKWHLAIELSESVANGLYMLRLQRPKDGSRGALPVLLQR